MLEVSVLRKLMLTCNRVNQELVEHFFTLFTLVCHALHVYCNPNATLSAHPFVKNLVSDCDKIVTPVLSESISYFAFPCRKTNSLCTRSTVATTRKHSDC